MTRVTMKDVNQYIIVANNILENADSRYRLALRSGYGKVGVDYTLPSNLGRGLPERHASPLMTKKDLWDWLGAFIEGLDAASRK